jgi:hypothetical protein
MFAIPTKISTAVPPASPLVPSMMLNALQANPNDPRCTLTGPCEALFNRYWQGQYMEWQDENGDFARDYFRIGPQLNLKHSENLQTSYKYQAEHESYQGYDVETHRVDATVTHQLYTNLTTTADLFGLKENADGSVDTDQYGGLIDWQYNRGNLCGRLFSSLTLAFDRQDTSSNLGRQIVVNEAQTFYDPIPVQLRNRNVIPWTVVVFDSGHRRIFRLGFFERRHAIGDRLNAGQRRTAGRERAQNQKYAEWLGRCG